VTLTVFILVLCAAALHVFWNTFVKTSRDKVSFLWLTSVAGSAVMAVAFLVARLAAPGPISVEVVAWAALSGLFEAAYLVMLFGAYDKADLSVTYPLSRGIAPLVVLPLGGLLLGDVVTPRHGAAVVVVAAGVAAVSLSAWAAAPHRRTLEGVALALAAGCLIAAYHLVDRRAMTLAARPSALDYLFLMHGFLALFVSAWIVLSRRRRKRALSEWPVNRRGVLVVGVGSPLAYFLIMVALRYGNVTYITAGRNVGIVISTVVGGVFLKERISWKRALGAVLIALGVAALVLFGRGGR
jgi:drug/metabolite transporter (DMT)-like permease